MRRIVISLGILVALAVPAFAAATAAAPYYINNRPAQADSGEPLNDVKQFTACDALAGYQRFSDHPRGYSVCVPAGLTPDFSLSAVRSVFADRLTQIELYYDDFRGSISHPTAYMVYANRFLPDSRRHTIHLQETFGWNGFTVNRIKWNRNPLASLKEDRNHYASLELLRYPHEAYTILIKSAQPIDNDLDILRSFRLIERRGSPGVFRRIQPARHLRTGVRRDVRRQRQRARPLQGHPQGAGPCRRF